MSHYESVQSLDATDRAIIGYLQDDARVPYTEIAKRLGVSSGTIHQRMNKLTEQKVITGSKVRVDYQRLGYDVVSILGLHLKQANDHIAVSRQLKQIPQVTEVYYTTGKYALLIKVQSKNMREFHRFLVEKLQAMPQVRSTESFICLEQLLDRDLRLSDL